MQIRQERPDVLRPEDDAINTFGPQRHSTDDPVERIDGLAVASTQAIDEPLAVERRDVSLVAG